MGWENAPEPPDPLSRALVHDRPVVTRKMIICGESAYHRGNQSDNVLLGKVELRAYAE